MGKVKYGKVKFRVVPLEKRLIRIVALTQDGEIWTAHKQVGIDITKYKISDVLSLLGLIRESDD